MLPHFGRLDLLQETVRSVLAQRDPNWRLTVVDDSGDAADDRVEQWCAGLGDRRVRYVRNAQNLGINRNFQKCVSLVEHDLAVIIGCDDLMLPHYVGLVRDVHREHPDVAVIQPGVQVVDGDGQPTRTLVDASKKWIYAPRVRGRLLMSGEELATSLLRGNWLYFPALCWRAAPLQRHGFREGLTIVQDLALVLDLVEDGESLLVDATPSFRYRRHGGSVSSAGALDGTRFDEERRFFAEVSERLAARGWHRAARAAHLHMSSRLNALTMLPHALRARRADGMRTLVRHAFARRAAAGRTPSAR